MLINAHMRHTTLAVLLVAGCTADLNDSSSSVRNVDGDVVGPLPGAIFTTLRDGTRVNANIYADKADVYLDGGPRRTQDAALPEGDYVFQVTDPSGQTLLSTDSIACRGFHIDVGGRITAVLGGSCAHAWGNDLVRPGNMTVQLMPYDDTPNRGGEYKVWVTTADAYQQYGAFLPRYSKTDNFKVRVENGSGGGSDEGSGSGSDQGGGSGSGSGSGAGSGSCGG